MTIAADRPERATPVEQELGDDARSRRWRLIAAIFAILALGLGTALVLVVAGDDDSSSGSVPDDVVAVLDDFARAFDERDVDLMESIITEDFSGTVDFYNPDTTEPAFTVVTPAGQLLRETGQSTFSVERSGDLLVAGDGPWIIAAHETWSDPMNQEEGTRIYVVVDDNGTPKLDGYYYAGVKVPVVPDFGN